MSPPAKPAVADYHVHSPYCGHAQGKIVDYVEAAVKAGLTEIGFSDHLGRYYLTKSQKRRYWDWGMQERHIGRYIAEVTEIAESFEKKIPVRCGMEVDFIDGADDLLTSILSPYPVDFLLGSIHCIPALGWKHLAHYQRKDSWYIYTRYFEQAEAAVNSGLFDSLAHIDFIWRYVKWPDDSADKVFDAIERVMKAAARTGTSVEINSNGYLWSQLYKVDGGDPFDVLLKSVKKNAVSISIGSDAHKPEFVGKSFEALIPALRKAGIKHYTTFEERKRITLPLPEC